MERKERLKTLAEVQRQLASGDFTFSRHAFVRAVERNISEFEIREAGANAVLVEAYPNDKYSPSALVLGFTQCGRPLHLQVSLAPVAQVKIVTLYEPTSDEWIDYFRRRGDHV